MNQNYYPIILSSKKFTPEVTRIILHPRVYHIGMNLLEQSDMYNILTKTMEYLLSPSGMFYKSRVVWAGSYSTIIEDKTYLNLYQNVSNLYEHFYTFEFFKFGLLYDTLKYQYIVNHTKQTYINKFKFMKNKEWLHPLPLLTSEGNEKGGYNSTNRELCGIWARDIISLESEIPLNYTELICNFNYI
jgi:hypothetical protein